MNYCFGMPLCLWMDECVWGVRCVGVHVHVKTRGQPWVPFRKSHLPYFCYIYWFNYVGVALEQVWRAESEDNLRTPFCPSNLRVLEPELRSPGLWANTYWPILHTSFHLYDRTEYLSPPVIPPGMPGSFTQVLGMELLFSCLYDKHFIKWTISPVPGMTV